METATLTGGNMEYGLFVGGQWIITGESIPVLDKYRGQVLGRVSRADGDMLEKAVRSAREAADGPIPSPLERAGWLNRTASLVEQRRELFARTIAREAGKPIKNARGEVSRAIETLTVSAEEAKRIAGHEVPVSAAPGAANRLGFTMRFPLGVVCAITPFNYPLNLVCHKIAPALAAGNAVVWKPSSLTPLTAVLLAEALEEAGVPAGFLNMLPGSGKTVGSALLADPRIDFYTFTGSLEVGKQIRKAIGIRRAAFELGSNCGVIVHRDADLETAARSCAEGAFSYAGQNCDSVQRIFIHRDIYPAFRERLTDLASSLKTGDPLEEDTAVGPMISSQAARSAGELVQSAVESGGVALCGGGLEGSILEPAVLENVPARHPVVCEEVFAPVVSIFPFDRLEEAVSNVNHSRYGLQAGVFTRDLDAAWYAAKRLRVGGVMVNENSCYRVDLMPFGGARESGVGREGPRYAIEEMTEQRLVVFNL
ncbi:aldehyde dehydrogenase [Desulfocucumis palustris]|uniref:Aldehyde dehydrogenase n=1 Tax=Desulfocucumis palustris TaxID=1898651 RepID=A0A2L2XFE4_9FIRM|nr:aldehyde dehydrogenase family protein [Desulfocucumis palustris]GBF32571.1 aldehyde dehydrogenase [Desulfocucumis palustris]